MRRRHIILFIMPLLWACVSKNDEGRALSDLGRVIEADTLRVTTLSRSTSYFSYRGEEMGYEFELAKRFSQHLGVELRVYPARDVNQMIEMLDKGVVDVIAYPVNINAESKEKVKFFSHEYTTNQVLVQPKQKKREIEVKDVIDLIGKEVYVVEDSKYHNRIKALDDEIGGGIQYQTLSNEYDEEMLVGMVSSGEIPYTVVDNNIAAVNKTYLKNIDCSVKVSLTQRSAWAMRRENSDLYDTLDVWLNQRREDYTLQYLYKKYFEEEKSIAKKYPKYINSEKISNYDNLFKKYATKLNWDWKLLASMAYQESRFNPEAKSWVGARGLMQLMPATALKYGVDSTLITQPEANLRAAVSYIKRVSDIFSYIENETERQKFVLASYNAGVGHVCDAMALAEKHGKSPECWNDVRVFILMKSKPEFFNDPVVKHGYLRGEEVYKFVDEIMLRYQEYDDVITD